MLGSMSFNSFMHYRQLAVAFLVREQMLKQWYATLRAYGEVVIPEPGSYALDWIEMRCPITRFDRLLTAHSTVPTERLYHIWSEVTDRRMTRFGRVRRMTVEPALTHREACTVLSKHTQYSWRRMWLVEAGSLEEQELAVWSRALDKTFEECVPVSTSAQDKRGRP